MKKIASLALVIVAMFSCIVFSACGDKYKKMSMSFCSTSGEVINELVLTKDEASDKNLDEKRLGVKFSGIKQKYIGEIVVYSYPDNVVLVDNYVYDGEICYFDVKAVKSSIAEDTKLIVKHLTTDRTESIKLRIEEKSSSLNVANKKYVVSVNSEHDHILKIKDLVTLVPASSTDKVYFKLVDEIKVDGISLIEEMVGEEEFVTGFQVSNEFLDSFKKTGTTNLSKYMGNVKLYPVTYMDGYEIKEDEYISKSITINFEPTYEDLSIESEDERYYSDPDTKYSMMGGTEDNPLQLLVNNLQGDELYNEVLLYAQLGICEILKEDLETYNKLVQNISEEILNDYEFSIVAPDCLTCTDLGDGRTLVNTGYSAKPVAVEMVLKPKINGDAKEVSGKFWIQPIVRGDKISAVKQSSKGLETLEDGQVVNIYTDYANSNGVAFKFDSYAESNLTVNSQFDYTRIKIAPEILYTELDDSEYKNIFVSEDVRYNGKNSATSIDVGNQKDLISIVKGNELLKFYIQGEYLVSEKISSVDEVYIKCVKTESDRKVKDFEFEVVSNYEGDLSYLKGQKDTSFKLKFEAYETIKTLNVYAGEHTGGGGFSIITDGTNPKVVNEVYLDISSTTEYDLVVGAENSIISTTDKALKNVSLSYVVKSEGVVTNPLKLQKETSGSFEVNNAQVQLSLDSYGVDIGKYIITFVQGEGDNGFKQEIVVYVYKSFNEKDEDPVHFNVLGLNENTFEASDELKNNYELYLNTEYIARSGDELILETIVDANIVNSGIIADYSYEFNLIKEKNDGKSHEVVNLPNNPKSKFFDFNTFDNKNITNLKFINGTIVDGEKYYIEYTIKVYFNTYNSILEKGEVKSEVYSKYFYIYDSIFQYDGITINHPYLTRYMYDYLGYYYKDDGVGTFELLVEDSKYWEYLDILDSANGRKVDWSITIASNISNSVTNPTLLVDRGERAQITFKAAKNMSFYECKINCTIYQFGKPYTLVSEVIVKKSILTDSLLAKTEQLKFDEIVSNIYNYSVNLHLNDELTINVEHLNGSENVDHKDVKLVVVDAFGNKSQNIAEIVDNKIKIKDVQSGYKLIVYSKDRLNVNIDSLIKDFYVKNNFISSDPSNMFAAKSSKGAYFIVNLHLEDGSSKETAYSIYNLNDFENMISDVVTGKSKGEATDKYYRIMSSINLSEINKDLLSELDKIDFDAKIFGYDANVNLYGLKLDDSRLNLLKNFKGELENITFEVKYEYTANRDAAGNLGVIGSAYSEAKITNVGVVVSGFDGVEIVEDDAFGGLIGVNNSENILFAKDFVAVKGSLKILGNGGYFGGYIGKNLGKVIGENDNTSVIDSAIINVVPQFSSYESGTGATGQLNLNVDNALASIGGIAGFNEGSISGVFVSGVYNVTNALNVGGVIGYNKWAIPSNWELTGISIVDKQTGVAYNSHLKSNVEILGGTNVGGIVGLDNYGNYDYCWYQVLPNETNAVLIGTNVGGIAGKSVGTKIYFSSMMSYRWDYVKLWDSTNKISIFNEENPDIKATGYAGGLIGLVVATTDLTTETDVSESTLIQMSSVNAFVSGVDNRVGGMYSTASKNEGDITIGYVFVPVYHSYFVGKLSQPRESSTDLCFANNLNSLIVDYSYSVNVNDGDNIYIASRNVTLSTDDNYWDKSDSLNGNYIYVSSETDENKPIFEIVPNDLQVYKKDGAKTETTLNLNYYNFNGIGYTLENLMKYNSLYNTHKIVELLDFDSSTKGNIRLVVKSSNNNAISISGDKLIVNSYSKDPVELTFTPVLNPNISATITVNLQIPLTGIEVSYDGLNELTSLEMANGQTVKLSVKSTGMIAGHSYSSNNEFGVFVMIDASEEFKVSGKKLKDLISVSSLEYIDGLTVDRYYEKDSSEYVGVYVPFGTTLTIHITDFFAKPFKIGVYPAMNTTDLTYYGLLKEFDLLCYRGATDISLSYDSAIIYPNDTTIINATITTDIQLYDNDVLDLILGAYVNNSIVNKDVLEIVAGSMSYNQSTKIQKVKFKLNLGMLSLSEDSVSVLKIDFKVENKTKTISFDILPQMIDKINISPYLYVGTYKEGDPNNKIELLSVLTPNKFGLIIVDIAPMNGYYEYIEISDITGNEEIKFIQVDGVYGNHIETYQLSKDGKGIRLVNVAGVDKLYILMQIDKDYTSKPHQVQVSAYYKNELLRSDIKTIEVKMLPSITVEYQLPNGDNKYFKTDVSGTTIVPTQYFANGTEAQFRITTANVTEDLEYSLLDDGSDVSKNFTLKNTYNNFFVLKCENAQASNLGKKVVMRLKVESNINGNIEQAIMDMEFQIVEYVIHSVSVTHSVDNQSKTEIYGNFYNNIELEFYFKSTDISYMHNGSYNDVDYRYDKNMSASADASLQSINNILKVLNGKDASVEYNLDTLNDNTYTFVTLNKGLRGQPLMGGARLKRKYETDVNTNNLIQITADKDYGNTIVVKEGYDESIKYAVDFELKLSGDYNWNIVTNNSSGTVNVSKNYDLSFVNSSSSQDYLLIKDENDFINISNGEKNYYILGKDLVLENYTPLDVNVAEFDGNGHTITIKSFAQFNTSEIKATLFTSIPENMMVKNLNVAYVSTIKETMYSFGSVSVDKNSPAGGVVNFVNEYADLCNNDTVNYTKATFAGLAAENLGVITNCKTSGKVALRASTVEANYATNGDYSIKFNIAGLVGTNNGFITHSKSEMQIFALANIGGLVVENNGKISSSEVTGKAVISAYNTSVDKTITTKVAGFVVENFGEITMSNTAMIYSGAPTSYQGIISSKDISSGFVYTNNGEISNCYVEITKVGYSSNTFTGFVYENLGRIKTSYTNINEGKQSNTHIYMFARTGTLGLENCLEFVSSTDYDVYIKNVKSENLTTYLYANDSFKRAVFEKHGYVFGDNESAVWTINRNRTMPSLVACLETVYVNIASNTGEYYYGVRDFVYNKITIDNPDGTVSYKMKVEFVNDNYGTKNNPYIIRNLEELDENGKLVGGWNYYMKNETTAYYRIVSDIVFSSIANPESSTYVFKGNIQGNDMMLSNIKLYVPKTQEIEAVGLFAKLITANDILLKNSIRNLKIHTTSIWASKGQAVGSLAGKLEGFNVYNITISTGDENIVGGNTVGGLVGYAYGKFDIDGVYTDVSVTSTMEILTNTYSILSSTNNEKNKDNLSSVYYAGSIVGVLDAYDSVIYNVNNDRDISKNYYHVRHVNVTGSIVNVGTIVGGAFGFVGERVSVDYVNVSLTSSKFKGKQYSAIVAGENRGVINNFLVEVDKSESSELENTETFKNADYVVGGVVGLNIGGLIQNGSAYVDIIKGVSNAVVGGIVGRNVSGTISNVTFDGKLLGMVTGGIIGADYSRTTMVSHITGASVLHSDCRKNMNLLPYEYVEYTNNGTEIKMENIVITGKTLNYYFDKAQLVYELEKSYEGDSENVISKYFYAYGLLVGYVDKDTESKYSNYASGSYVSSKTQVSYGNNSITFGVSETNDIIGNSNISCKTDSSGKLIVENVYWLNAGEYGVSADGWYFWNDENEKGVMNDDEFEVKLTTKPLQNIQVENVSGLTSSCFGFIVGATVNNNNYDSWSKDNGFSNNFVIFAKV